MTPPALRAREATGAHPAAFQLHKRDNNNGFYSNLFYILIAVLGAFAMVSVINFLRTRRRRRIIFDEADRLGLMVPGMPGYVPMRDRPLLIKADGWRTPDWWEMQDRNGSGSRLAGVAEHKNPSGGEPVDLRRAATTSQAAAAGIGQFGEGEYGARGALEVTSIESLNPIAVVPVPIEVDEPPKPLSRIKYFPNYVSYLKTAHDPKPPRFPEGDPHAYDSVIGEPLEVVVAVRMPRPPLPPKPPRGPDDEDDDAVMDEWGGLELGIASWVVVKE